MSSKLVKSLYLLVLSVVTLGWLWVLIGPTQSDMDLSATGSILTAVTTPNVPRGDLDGPESEIILSQQARKDGLILSSANSFAFNSIAGLTFGDVPAAGPSAMNGGSGGSANGASSPGIRGVSFIAGAAGSSGGGGSGGGGGGAAPAARLLVAVEMPDPMDVVDTRPNDLITPAVPEPSTWAMMLLGFVGIAFLGYRRRTKAVLSA